MSLHNLFIRNSDLHSPRQSLSIYFEPSTDHTQCPKTCYQEEEEEEEDIFEVFFFFF